ncbi:MAG: hypothetical protein AB7U79_07770 [Candidatus Izemoplasmatales bacterium]
MKIKIRFVPDLLLDYLFFIVFLLGNLIFVYLNSFDIGFYFTTIYLIIVIANILFSHFIFSLIIDINQVKIRKRFIYKTININKGTTFYIKPFLGLKCFRKRLIIETDISKLILWDQFNVPLEKIIEEIVRKNPDVSNLVIK